jgi:RND family efflux transporter MFP subunit
MKRWQMIAAVVIVFVIIISVLIFNKRKMASLTPGGIQDIYYVKVENVSKKNLNESLSLTGVVNANNDVNIISETQGKITSVFVKVGDYKTAGSVLFQVDDELRKAALMSAEANFEKAKKDYQRFQDLFNQKSVSDSQLDQAKLAAAIAEAQYITAKRQLNDTQIKTPISGTVTGRYVDVGSMVQSSPQPTLVANIVDISRLKVKLNVAENDVFMMKVGDPVSVTSDIYPGIKFKGRVETISSKSDEAHTYPIEIIVPNENAHPLKAGMFARIEFTSLKDRSVIVIPREALVGSVKNPQVYVVENGNAKLRNLILGDQAGLFVQVVQGLVEGETIVVNGQNNLVENVKVEILK